MDLVHFTIHADPTDHIEKIPRASASSDTYAGVPGGILLGMYNWRILKSPSNHFPEHNVNEHRPCSTTCGVFLVQQAHLFRLSLPNLAAHF